MAHLVAVTGASGNIGRVLVERLLRKQVSVRVIGRSRDKLAPFVARGAEERVGDLQDSSFLNEALREVDAMFAMIPEHPDHPDFLGDKRRTAASLAGAIRAASVPRVVALSAIGVSPPSGIGPAAPNGEFEGLLKSIPGLSLVVLRPAFLMENYLGSIPLMKGAGMNGGAIHSEVPFAMICTQDIASVAADYLIGAKFQGQTVHELLGPRDYTCREATSILGGAIGKPDLPYVELPYEGLHKGLVGAGFSRNAATALVELQTALNEGRVQRLARRTESNTTPTTLEAFARDVFAPAYRAS
ncbi:MAG TPA: NAD(P)H-binding protein [Bacteroidota bacterium]|jgi:uncharacterized protein YbjT (DUF2867 family)